MVDEKDIPFAKLNIKNEDKLESIKRITLKFIENPDLDLDKAALEEGIKIKSLMHYLRKLEKLGIIKLQTTEQVGIAQQKIRAAEVKVLGSEAERIATLVLGVGGPLIRHYLPLFDMMLLRGNSVDDIARDVGEWYSLRLTTKKYIADLELQIEKLKISTDQAWAIARDNFKFLLKTLLTDKFSRDVFRAKRLGLHINLKKVTRDYARALELIDRDLEDERSSIVIDAMRELEVYDEKQPNFYASCEKGLWLQQDKILQLEKKISFLVNGKVDGKNE